MSCPYCSEPYKPLVDSEELGEHAHFHAVIEPVNDTSTGESWAYINVTTFWYEGGIRHSDDGYLVYITHCPRCGRKL